MRITALARGGLSVHNGFYDPRTNEAVLRCRVGETFALVIEYPSAPTSMATSGAAFEATVPEISGNKATIYLIPAQANESMDVTASVGGASRTVRLRAEIYGETVSDIFQTSLSFDDYRNSSLIQTL